MTGSMQPATGPDPRREALGKWVSAQVGQPVRGEPASADASFRRYFRFHLPDRTLVAMDAPPERENCGPFLDVAARLHAVGLHVPRVLAQDLAQGFLLLDDLGTRTWLDLLDPDNADILFNKAIPELVRMQQVDASGLPAYDETLLRRELELFPEWYLTRHLGQHLGQAPDDSIRASLDRVFDLLVEHALSQPKVFVHRDFMPRNLMDSSPNPGVLDFQDAVLGPISYDPICLFKDAFLSWPEADVQRWLEVYWRQGRDAGLPLPDDVTDFLRDCDLMGAHRHLKVIGIFARIAHRDGKPKYLEDVPRFFTYLRRVVARRPELGELGRILERIGE